MKSSELPYADTRQNLKRHCLLAQVGEWEIKEKWQH